MSPEEAFADVVRIFIMVGVFVVAAMVGAPVEGGVFERAGTKN